jgi:hypothetical protein
MNYSKTENILKKYTKNGNLIYVSLHQFHTEQNITKIIKYLSEIELTLIILYILIFTS